MSQYSTEQFHAFYTNLVQFDNHLGMTLQIHQPGHITYTLPIQPHHLTAPDVAHGGVVAALMDATLGVAALSLAMTHGKLCATAEFKISYLAPVHAHDTLTAEGTIDRYGTSLIFAAATITTQDNRTVAKGMGTFSQYPIEKRFKTNTQPPPADA